MKERRKYFKRMKVIMMKKKKKKKRKEKIHKKVKMKTLQYVIQNIYLEEYKRIILNHKSYVTKMLELVQEENYYLMNKTYY